MSHQLTLILPLPRYRKTDPYTSKQAANKAAHIAPSQRNIIADALREPGTVKDVAERTGLTQYAVSKRLPELERTGLIVATGVEREGCREWRRND